jgi:hypothetical protein
MLASAIRSWGRLSNSSGDDVTITRRCNAVNFQHPLAAAHREGSGPTATSRSRCLRMRNRPSMAFWLRLRAAPMETEERPVVRGSSSRRSSSAVHGLFRLSIVISRTLPQPSNTNCCHSNLPSGFAAEFCRSSSASSPVPGFRPRQIGDRAGWLVRSVGCS